MADVSPEFSPRVLERLLAGGWWPERRVSLEAIREGLTRYGFVMHEAAERVLERFEGLKIRDDRGSYLSFDGLALARLFEEDELPYLRRLHSALLCPVGRSANMGMYYLSAADGKWLALHEGWSVVYTFDSLEDLFQFSLLEVNPSSGVMRLLKAGEFPDGY